MDDIVLPETDDSLNHKLHEDDGKKNNSDNSTEPYEDLPYNLLPTFESEYGPFGPAIPLSHDTTHDISDKAIEPSTVTTRRREKPKRTQLELKYKTKKQQSSQKSVRKEKTAGKADKSTHKRHSSGEDDYVPANEDAKATPKAAGRKRKVLTTTSDEHSSNGSDGHETVARQSGRKKVAKKNKSA